MAPTTLTPDKILTNIFKTLSLPLPLPPYTLTQTSSPLPLPSSYNLPLLITTTTLLSTLTPSLLLSHRNSSPPTQITVSSIHAAAQYLSERLYTINNTPSNVDRILTDGLHP